jgi:hypothetical protein
LFAKLFHDGRRGIFSSEQPDFWRNVKFGGFDYAQKFEFKIIMHSALYRVACLSSLKIEDLASRLLTNVYVQYASIKYVRTARYDEPLTSREIKTFRVERTKENYYIPPQRLLFSTPLLFDSRKPTLWEDFMEDLRFFYEMNRGNDPEVEKRVYVGDIVLLELPEGYGEVDKWKHSPLDDEDKLYDGERCIYSYFSRWHWDIITR